MSTAIPRADAPADPPADATPEPAPAKRTLVQRVPAPVFITVYGVLVVAVIVAGAMLASYAQRGGETPSQRLEAASRATTEAEAEAADPETTPPTETAEPSPAEPPAGAAPTFQPAARG
ncbi:hypothetical protein JKI95_10260 [Corynebacterium aquatimens]|uniref:hypothetical protein n=1 Tax=Corynebacterium aquatimens TaxID=1190508 RepID=UPI0025417FC9|nr:hypothetical protein [Corynebacterium aquatimens]QYH19454.1 hypothetical protein JKI95_10260 [Corynebacterium aquatimens]